jgi:hypothetical protein
MWKPRMTKPPVGMREKMIIVVVIEKNCIPKWYNKGSEEAFKVNRVDFRLYQVEKKEIVKTDFWIGYMEVECHVPNQVRERLGNKGNVFKLVHQVVVMSKL